MKVFNKKVTVGRAVSELSGYGSFKQAVSSAWSYQKGMARIGYSLFKSTISTPELTFKIDDTIKDEHERFAQATQLSGNSNALKEIEDSLNKRAQFWLIAFVAMFVFGLSGLNPNGIVYSAIVGHGLKAALILPFCIALLFLSRWIRWSFWAYQIRERALWSFKKWLFNPREWITNKHLSTGAKLMLFFVVSATFLNGTADQAIAQQLSGLASASGGGGGGGGDSVTNSSVFTSLMGNLSSSDLSLQFLENLFPSQFASTGVSFQNDAVAQMLEAVNLTLLAIGSALVFWFTTHAVVASASEGVVLGQRWHTVWVPVRVTVGVASTVPYHGFCLAQLIMMQLIMSGCGLANLAWDSYVQFATGNGGRSVVAVTVPPQITTDDSTFNNILNHALCVKVGEYVYSTKGAPTTDPSKIDAYPVIGWIGAHIFGKADSGTAFNMPTSPDMVDGSAVYNFGPACGSITINKPDAETSVGNYTNNIKPNKDNVVVDIPPGYNQDKASAQAANAFLQAKADAMNKFIGQVMTSPVLDDLASSVVAGGTAVAPGATFSDINTLRSDYAAYNAAVLTAAETAVTASNTAGMAIIQNMANNLGWASAGALEPQLIAVSAKIDSIMATKPDFTNGDPGSLDNKQFNEALAAAKMQVISAESTSQNLAPTNPTGSQKTGSTSSMLSSLVANPTNGGYAIIGSIYGMYLSAMDAAAPSTAAPLQYISGEGEAAKSAGYAILGTAFVLAGVNGATNGGVVGTVAKLTGVKGFLSGVLGVIIPMIVAIGEMMIVAGIVMEYILPMIPYFIWVSAFVGYMVFAIEAIICAAFWGFSHIKADGEDSFAGQAQSYGYGIALIAIFYPTLMVIGLIMANVLLAATVTFISQTFELAQGSSSGYILDPIGLIGVLIAMIVFYISMIARCYRLISGLPEWCSRWFGISASMQRDDTHGEAARFGDSMQNNLSSKVGQMGAGKGLVQSFGAKSSGGGGGGGQVAKALGTKISGA